MGYGSPPEDVLLVLDALEAALKQQAFRPAGDARSAAQKALAAQCRRHKSSSRADRVLVRIRGGQRSPKQSLPVY